ncbi:ATP-dependent helicase [Candidatus Woesearchaeota archaeon]|nr:ATP-dependent helicase [Candidatus Woesearchaeota archaeon]
MEKPHEDSLTTSILHPLLKQLFFEKFTSFSEPQRYSIYNIHCRINTLVSAPTGSGKTLSAFGAVLNELIDHSEKGTLQDRVYCVYVSPLRALSNDIHKNLVEPLEQMENIAGKKLGIRVGIRTGDTTSYEKSKMLKTPPHILITTPESLAIMLASIKFVEHLRNVEWVVIDEVHAIADNKRGVHLSLALETLSFIAPHITRIGLSATVAPLEKVAGFLVGSSRNCQIVDVQFLKKLDLQVICPVPDLIGTAHEVMHAAMYKVIDDLVQQHKTTLIFTNTRSATERVVDHLKHKFPKNYTDNIGAHHGSLGKELRQNLERRLREGKLKCVVCSTSLELGIDIGYIDLVICLSSPKSVARFLQRAGRAGHKLHETVKGRIIVMDRDDLVECSVLLKAAVEKKIDKIHIPVNCLDVLAQYIDGLALMQVWDEEELFQLVKRSYCYRDLKHTDYLEVLLYLAGEFTTLEDRHIFAKIWRQDGKLGKRGKLGRIIYMTNLGTIPDESFVIVKVGTQTIGHIDEGFLEKLRPGDVFILGGDTYQFKFSRGMVAQVVATSNRPPTVPSWFSDMLPLSFDLANEIGHFRFLMEDKFKHDKSKKDILDFIHEYLYVDANSSEALYNYFAEQYEYAGHFPSDRKILIEHYTDNKQNKIIFHTLFGRRVNDVLSRGVAFAIARMEHRDVEIGMNDNGFYVGFAKKIDAVKALKTLKSDKLDLVMKHAIDQTEILKRRFRHCATRGFMILRNYMGRQKNAGRQQVSSMILMSAVKRISDDFCILKEARREVLEDLMEIENSKKVLREIEEGKIRLVEIQTKIPTPFAFNIALQGFMDVLKIEDKIAFLQRMHELVLAKISLEKGRK